MTKEELHKDFIDGIIKHDYSYMYSDYHVAYKKGSDQLDRLMQQVNDLVIIHKISAEELLDECLNARTEQYKDGLTHAVIRSLFKPYHNRGILS